MEISGCII